MKEGWGLVVLEAMESGLPVLRSDISVFKEYLQHEENAFMVSAEDDSSIAFGIEKLAVDLHLKQRLASSGPKTAELYSWESTAKAHLEYYYDILSAKSKPLFQHEF